MDNGCSPYYQQEPVQLNDCNECKWLNITEYDQRNLALIGLHMRPHICERYIERVVHKDNGLDHHSYIYPCDKCVKDNYKHYEHY